jgi:hypothetical protein
MCLIDKKKYRWTKEDIPIWKVVRIKFSPISREFFSPYKCTLLTTTNVVVDEKKPSALRMFFANLVPGQYEFARGFFHAFTRYEDAVTLKDYFEDSYNGFYTIVKGYIPKNTRYAISMYHPYEVCARKMILNI